GFALPSSGARCGNAPPALPQGFPNRGDYVSSRAETMLRALIIVALTCGSARADYAIVIGSNAGGPGQTELRYAEDDARKVGATLTVVVLDACQSGAFSRIKGAQPAADFSYSSRQHLDASGVAVLASSSGSELSQESEQLRGSFFTHHLLVGLRGAGDANGDGQVSIDEAYRYAYHQTLMATAETAVGGQHVTFEVDLKGHGDVALTFPRAAT